MFLQIIIAKYGINIGTVFNDVEVYANGVTCPQNQTGKVTFYPDSAPDTTKLEMLCGNPAPLTEADIQIDVDPNTYELIVSSLKDEYCDFLDTINVISVNGPLHTDSSFVTVKNEPTVAGTKKSVRIPLRDLQSSYADP